MKKIAIVILNWNGEKFLKQFLPSVIKFSDDADIIVADNASTDNSLKFLHEHHPSVIRIKLSENYGFAGGYNKALIQIKDQYEYYCILNSDIEVSPNWISPIVSYLDTHKNVAACQPKILSYHSKMDFEYAGASGGFIDYLGYPFCRGRIFDTVEKDSGQYDANREIFWATGAALFIRCKVFHEMNGFDETYFAHMEEIDLCWRIKNQGHKIMVIPASTVYHVGGGTLNKTSPFKTFLNFRNSLLTLHKNIHKNRWRIIFSRLLLDGIAGIRYITQFEFQHCLAIIKAHFAFYRLIPQNRKKRQTNLKNRNTTGIYQKSILKQYFLKGKKEFSDIAK